MQLLNGYGRTKAKRHEENDHGACDVYKRAGAHALRQPKLATDIDASGGRLAETSPHGGHLIARDLPLAGECDGRLTPGRGEPWLHDPTTDAPKRPWLEETFHAEPDLGVGCARPWLLLLCFFRGFSAGRSAPSSGVVLVFPSSLSRT